MAIAPLLPLGPPARGARTPANGSPDGGRSPNLRQSKRAMSAFKDDNSWSGKNGTDM
jgi:hypothetical protein